MSSGGCVASAVEGGIDGCAVLPAAPDDAEPGGGQDPDGVLIWRDGCWKSQSSSRVSMRSTGCWLSLSMPWRRSESPR